MMNIQITSIDFPYCWNGDTACLTGGQGLVG